MDLLLYGSSSVEIADFAVNNTKLVTRS